MNNDTVVRTLCRLTTLVGTKRFQNRHATDCFCGAQPFDSSFQFSPEVLDYIKAAVVQRLVHDGADVSSGELNNI